MTAASDSIATRSTFAPSLVARDSFALLAPGIEPSQQDRAAMDSLAIHLNLFHPSGLYSLELIDSPEDDGARYVDVSRFDSEGYNEHVLTAWLEPDPIEYRVLYWEG